ncbi:E3 ubiquitin-protein ligase LRSAM1-like [Pollicipes pollicipes]|uniref:E3 ubiquitin-protein ligase LRSAM1-like n=1 Tax=Pollicipes pollicipes TaxID=41117 RepID=UPI001885317F|nr:E3 ubiquitin-protein ligase LRSAM1-like [Pollicipes pollicipes]
MLKHAQWLQRKICLAEETPEPVYDLSNCLLRTIPPGTYAKCKVLRKLQLLLQDNLLTSLESGGQLSDLHLLQVLHLEFNCLIHLPHSISSLASLQVLDLSNNALKELPASIGELHRLRRLLCRGNGLRSLPAAVGRLPRLATLDLRNNQLHELAPLANISRMEEVRLEDNKALLCPPPEVVSAGSDAVITYLCREARVRHTGPAAEDEEDSVAPTVSRSVPDSLDAVKDEIHRYDQLKESRRLEMLQIEQQLSMSKSQEGRELSKQEEFKKQLLDELVEEQARLDGRTWRASPNSLEQLVIVRQEECDALREHEVMESMQQLMRESLAMQNQLQEYQEGRDRALQQALSQDQQTDAQLRRLLEVKGSEQEARIQQLLKDEAFQRQAFFNLYLQQSDV